MRFLLLLAAVLVFLPVAFTRPKWGLLGYIVFALCRPDILAWTPSGRLSLLIAAATLLGTALSLQRWFGQMRNPFVLLFLLFLAICFLSSILAVLPDRAFPRYFQFLRASILAIAIPVLLTTEEEVTQGMLAIVAGLGVIATKYGLYGIWHGGVRYAGGYGGMMADNNTMALALVMGIPLAYYAISLVHRRWALALLGVTFFLITTMIMTFSRGAALSFGVALLMIIRGAKYRLAAVLVIVLLGIPAILLVGPSYFERIDSIGNYDSDRSIQSRLDNSKTALAMWRDYPVLGVGFGGENQQALFRFYAGDRYGASLVVHNTYAQLLTDTGALGFIAYIALLFGAIWWLGRSAKKTKKLFPGMEVYPRALQASLVSFAVGSTFLSRVDFDLTYMILMCCAAWWSVYRKKLRAFEQAKRTAITSPAGIPEPRRKRVAPSRALPAVGR